MARPIFSHEVLDADFQWLLNHYCQSHPSAVVLDHTGLPVVIVLGQPRLPPLAVPGQLANSPQDPPTPSDEPVSEDK